MDKQNTREGRTSLTAVILLILWCVELASLDSLGGCPSQSGNYLDLTGTKKEFILWTTEVNNTYLELKKSGRIDLVTQTGECEGEIIVDSKVMKINLTNPCYITVDFDGDTYNLTNTVCSKYCFGLEAEYESGIVIKIFANTVIEAQWNNTKLFGYFTSYCKGIIDFTDTVNNTIITSRFHYNETARSLEFIDSGITWYQKSFPEPPISPHLQNKTNSCPAFPGVYEMNKFNLTVYTIIAPLTKLILFSYTLGIPFQLTKHKCIVSNIDGTYSQFQPSTCILYISRKTHQSPIVLMRKRECTPGNHSLFLSGPELVETDKEAVLTGCKYAFYTDLYAISRADWYINGNLLRRPGPTPVPRSDNALDSRNKTLHVYSLPSIQIIGPGQYECRIFLNDYSPVVFRSVISSQSLTVSMLLDPKFSKGPKVIRTSRNSSGLIKIAGCEIETKVSLSFNRTLRYFYIKNGYHMTEVFKPKANAKIFPDMIFTQPNFTHQGYYQCMLRVTGLADILSDPVDVQFQDVATTKIIFRFEDKVFIDDFLDRSSIHFDDLQKEIESKMMTSLDMKDALKIHVEILKIRSGTVIVDAQVLQANKTSEERLQQCQSSSLKGIKSNLESQSRSLTVEVESEDCCSGDVSGDENFQGQYVVNTTLVSHDAHHRCSYDPSVFSGIKCLGNLRKKPTWADAKVVLPNCPAKFSLTNDLLALSDYTKCVSGTCPGALELSSSLLRILKNHSFAIQIYQDVKLAEDIMNITISRSNNHTTLNEVQNYREKIDQILHGNVTRKNKVRSVILAVTILNTSNLSPSDQRVELKFRIAPRVSSEEVIGKKSCSFWDFALGKWSNYRCHKVKEINNIVTCQCDHLTNFALLLDVSQKQYSSFALEVVTWIGAGISLSALVITFAIYIFFKKILLKTLQRKIMLCLCSSIMALLVVFLAGIEQTQTKLGCQIVASLIQYFTLTTFSWMLVESTSLYRRFVKYPLRNSRMDGREKYLLKASVFSWGFPLIIVVITATISPNSLGNDQFCVVVGYSFYLGVVLPVAATLTISYAALIFIMRSLVKQSIKSSKILGKTTSFTEQFRTALSMATLLGLTWIFGLLALSEISIICQWVFTVLNVLQGFFIFIFQTVRNPEVKKALLSYLRDRKISGISKKPSTLDIQGNELHKFNKKGTEKERSKFTSKTYTSIQKNNKMVVNNGTNESADVLTSNEKTLSLKKTSSKGSSVLACSIGREGKREACEDLTEKEHLLNTSADPDYVSEKSMGSDNYAADDDELEKKQASLFAGGRKKIDDAEHTNVSTEPIIETCRDDASIVNNNEAKANRNSKDEVYGQASCDETNVNTSDEEISSTGNGKQSILAGKECEKNDNQKNVEEELESGFNGKNKADGNKVKKCLQELNSFDQQPSSFASSNDGEENSKKSHGIDLTIVPIQDRIDDSLTVNKINDSSSSTNKTGTMEISKVKDVDEKVERGLENVNEDCL